MSGMVEFRITSDLQEIRKQAITTNYADVKAWVDGVAEQYRSIVVTEDGVQAAKQDRANLRKLQANIDQVRKECRAAALTVSAETEANCKELVATLETAVQSLDTQAKAFEDRRRSAKEAALKDYFEQENERHNTTAYLTWNGVLDKKWLNATTSEDTAKKAIDAVITDTVNGIAAIVSLQSPFEVELLDYYRGTHDVTAVLQKNARLLEMKKAQEEREKAAREAAEAKRLAEEEARNAVVLEEPAPQESPSVADVIRSVEQEAFAYAAVEEEPTYTLYFDPHCTDEQFLELLKYMDGAGIRRTLRVEGVAAHLNGLKAYMKEHGIRFGRVPE
nr:MAG TPA: Protein of unknown function (DUF1351) [Caudoviricetes sp.]